MKPRPLAAGILVPFFILTYVALAVNAGGLIRTIRIVNLPTAVFVATAFAFYCLFFLSPVIVLSLIGRRILT